MKNRILTFIIGILVGAIITTSCFLIFSKKININRNERIPMNFDGQMDHFNQEMSEPPAKPEGDFQKEVPNKNI